MSNTKQRETRRLRQIWREALVSELSAARRDLGLAADEYVSDAALLAEVEAQIPSIRPGQHGDYDLRPRRQWFGWRLLGFGATPAELDWLAGLIEQGRGGGMIPWGLGGSSRRSRRSEEAGRRRNQRRRRRALDIFGRVGNTARAPVQGGPGRSSSG